MLSEIFTSQRESLDYFFTHIDSEESQTCFDQMVACRGSIVFTGVGKSGLIADKLAKTLISTGTKAFYLPPTDALHGDLGALSQDDLVIFMSKSGKSHEVLELAAIIHQRGIRSIGWVSMRDSPLEKLTDFMVHLPLKKEICPFDLAPTTSTSIQLIFGDVMAAAMMRVKKFTVDQYALNHPGGAIGKLIAQKVKDVMIQGADLPLCRGEDLLKEKLVELSKKRLGCLLIIDHQGVLEGIFTDGDLRRGLEKSGEEVLYQKMDSLMTRTFSFASPEMLTSKAIEIMEGREKRVMMLPVLQEAKLVGLVHLHDILSPSFQKHESIRNVHA